MSISSLPYAIARTDIVFESFDGDAVVLDLGQGRYYGFSDSGSQVWQALILQVPPAALVGQACAGQALSASDVEGFVGRLLGFGLLAASPEASPVPLPAAIAEALQAAREPLSVEMHDELADLLLVDPIHDVEEQAGWPIRKQ
ncbi:PqqD family protein [Solimonas soli]|uniref:PqqD family protein n=1 Tax=Solimonas soli TaxID=413479 RepID=UPI0004885276|nr:PqqD family protein [Solimonas soli]